ncbi:hypothetical protein CUMW_187350 [Citrus unshiu]|nr:hypothetical protein CUMW_187350 [Citrus unshiu]
MSVISLFTICFMQLNAVGQASDDLEQIANPVALAPSQSRRYDNRPEVRRQSYIEMQIFRNRWKHAVEDDKCWVDPYGQSTNQTSH